MGKILKALAIFAFAAFAFGSFMSMDEGQQRQAVGPVVIVLAMWLFSDQIIRKLDELIRATRNRP